jgi:hypothetical protein
LFSAEVVLIFQENANRSVNDLRILFNIDITQINSQWVNAGAGVWVVNEDAFYPYVDASLLSAFSAQFIPAIGSVVVDSTLMAQASTLLFCCNNNNTFYYDGANLYIHISGGDAPFYHVIEIGIANGYSREGFTPVGSTVHYPSRLLSVPSISLARDPLFWGKLQYEGGSAELNNGDGEFDLLAEDYNVYGNQARVLLGFRDLDISQYERIFTGYIETVGIGNEQATIDFKDKRKQLSKQITYTCTALNGITAIQNILLANYDIAYDTTYYNMVEWEDARSKAANVTITATSAQSTIDLIEGICRSIFGIFIVDKDGKFTAKIVRSGDASDFEIPNTDILNYPRAIYDPSEVVTSVKVGYARDWTTTGSAYTYYINTSQESAIYSKYRVYNQRTIDTYLPDLSSAVDFSNTILDYAGTVRPVLDIEVPLKYWNITVGDFCDIEIDRQNAPWFGIRKCEVIGKSFNIERGTVSLTVKKYGEEITYRITTDGASRVTTDGDIRKAGS